MTDTLTRILDAQDRARQLSIDDLLTVLEQDEAQAAGGANGFKLGDPVGHVDFGDFRGVVVGPGKDGKVLVKVTAGWRGGALPTWPVSITAKKLVEV